MEMQTTSQRIPRTGAEGAISQVLLQEMRRDGGINRTFTSPVLIRKPSGDDVTTFSSDSFCFSIIGQTNEKFKMTTEDYTVMVSEAPLNTKWSRSTKSGTINGVNGIIAPPYTHCEIETGNPYAPLYVSSVKSMEGHKTNDFFGTPLGFSQSDIKRHLVGHLPVKLMVPENPYGHDIAADGSRLLSNPKRDLILGPKNQEFSAGGAASRQDFHLHSHLHEIYLAFGNLKIFHVAGGRIGVIEASNGDAIIINPGTPHYALMEGNSPNFVIMASKHPIARDKHVIADDVTINHLLESQMRKYA